MVTPVKTESGMVRKWERKIKWVGRGLEKEMDADVVSIQ